MTCHAPFILPARYNEPYCPLTAPQTIVALQGRYARLSAHRDEAAMRRCAQLSVTYTLGAKSAPAIISLPSRPIARIKLECKGTLVLNACYYMNRSRTGVYSLVPPRDAVNAIQYNVTRCTSTYGLVSECTFYQRPDTSLNIAG